MTLLRLALRSHRAGLIGVSAILALFGFANTFGYIQIVGESGPARSAFALQMEILGRQLLYLLPLPERLETLAGYLQWRMFGLLPLIFGFWGVLAGTGAGRGEEERGLVELWLAAGVSRGRWLVVRVLAFMLTAAAAIAAMTVVIWLGASLTAEPLDGVALAAQAVVVGAFVFCVFGLALAAAQLAGTRRGAMGLVAIVLGALYAVNFAARGGAEIGALGWASPFWIYDHAAALQRGALDGLAVLGLALSGLGLVGLAVAAFVHRDLGGALLHRRTSASRASLRASSDPLLRLPVLALLRQQRVAIASWVIGMGVYSAFVTSLARPTVDALANTDIPALRAFFESQGGAGYESFIGSALSGVLLLLISIFAIVQVSAWAADDAEGRLGATLAAPVSRDRVVIERLVWLALVLAILVGVSALASYVVAARDGIVFEPGRFALAALLLVPVGMALGAIGHSLLGWRPRMAEAVLIAVAVSGYFIQQFSPLFGWPEWVERLSLYSLYGSPLIEVETVGTAVLLALVLGAGALALGTMRRRDVGA